jgi:hypothetical protein
MRAYVIALGAEEGYRRSRSWPRTGPWHCSWTMRSGAAFRLSRNAFLAHSSHAHPSGGGSAHGAIAMPPSLCASGVSQRRRGVGQRRRDVRQRQARSHPPNKASRPTHDVRASPHVPRAITAPRLGEALCGGDDLQRCTASHVTTVHTFRDRSQTHAWAKPCLAARIYNAVPFHTSRERRRTTAWAKPCLAGRPTALVRTQSCEKNTSRSRPAGMELPDYPVVALTQHRRTRMGSHFTIPPGLFPDSYLVLLPAGLSKRMAKAEDSL